jgi:hypothetical protein
MMTLQELQAMHNATEKKKPQHEESRLQRACIKWFRLAHPHIVIFAIPNGGKRGAREAAIMKSEGTLAGVADLFVMFPNNWYHGLFIEMKTDIGKQTEKQKFFQAKSEEAGYCYRIARSFDEFRIIVDGYLATF